MIQTLVWKDNISMDNVERFKLAIEQLPVSNSKGIILNLDGVSYMNSRALGIIANTAREAKKQGKQLIIINNEESIREIFTIVQFEAIVQVYSTELQAKNYLEETLSLPTLKMIK